MSPKSTAQPSAREINRALLQSVGNDWIFPPKKTQTKGGAQNVPAKDPVGFRERYYCSSDDDSDDDFDDFVDGGGVEPEETGSAEQEQLTSASTDGVSFESPDAVAAVVDRKLHARKRKKLRLLDEELAYNDGLCFFLRRRNAWTCAKPRAECQPQQPPHQPDDGKDKDPQTKEKDPSETASHPRQTDSPDPQTNDAGTTPTTAPSPTEAQPQTQPSTVPAAAPAAADEADAPQLQDVLLPIAPPILPRTHAFRASLLERPDRELYEKLVRDGRTPAVPVNLAHMLRVIVRGWQDEGNWPPKGVGTSAASAAAAAAAGQTGGGGPETLSFGAAGGGRKRVSGSGRGGVVVAARVGQSSTGQAAQGDALNRGILSSHKHLRQGVESVRRVLRFNNNTAPPGD